MAKMNEYPSVDDQQAFTPAQKAAFLDSAMCIATGSKTDGGNKVTANIPLSDINPVPTPAAEHANVGMVLTVQQASDPNDPDEIVWSASQGSSLPPNPSDYADYCYVLGINKTSGEPTWYKLDNGSGGTINYK